MAERPVARSAKPSRKKAVASFTDQLVASGGELLAPTNPYEVMRFKTRYGTGVVYRGKRGETWNDAAIAARDHLERKAGGSLAPVQVRGRRKGRGTVEALLKRDGENCFFCGLPLGDDITVEHLVSVTHGGPNHISNCFLAHGACNADAGHKSAPEKISIAVASRVALAAAARTEPPQGEPTC